MQPDIYSYNHAAARLQLAARGYIRIIALGNLANFQPAGGSEKSELRRSCSFWQA